MGIFKSLVKLVKGGSHAEGTEERVSGRNGRERGIIHSFSSIRERAISDICGIRVLAAACADERSRDIGTLSPDKIRQESDVLIAAAKKTGHFMEAASVPGTRYTIRTGESEVRLVQREQIYYKIKNPYLLTSALKDESRVNELLFAIYGITKSEQKFIESLIKPME